MRILMKVSMPIDKGNELARAGKLGSTIQEIIEEQQPEAVYFSTAQNGWRNAFVIVDLEDASRIPALAEPWFLACDAEVHMWPVFTPDEMPEAVPHIDAAVEKYG